MATEAEITDYRAKLATKWKDFVVTFEAYIEAWQDNNAFANDHPNPPPYAPQQFFPLALRFLDELLIHLPPVQARALLHALPKGWVHDPEKWIQNFEMEKYINVALPEPQWGDGIATDTNFEDGQAVGFWALKRLSKELGLDDATITKALDESDPAGPMTPPKPAAPSATTNRRWIWPVMTIGAVAVALLVLFPPARRQRR